MLGRVYVSVVYARSYELDSKLYDDLGNNRRTTAATAIYNRLYQTRNAVSRCCRCKMRKREKTSSFRQQRKKTCKFNLQERGESRSRFFYINLLVSNKFHKRTTKNTPNKNLRVEQEADNDLRHLKYCLRCARFVILYNV